MDKQGTVSQQELRERSMQQLISMGPFQEAEQQQEPGTSQSQEQPDVRPEGHSAGRRRTRRTVRFAPYATYSRGEGAVYTATFEYGARARAGAHSFPKQRSNKVAAAPADQRARSASLRQRPYNGRPGSGSGRV